MGRKFSDKAKLSVGGQLLPYLTLPATA